MKQYITSLIDLLSSIDAVKYADVDWGQMDQENPPVRYPAVLVSLDEINYTDLAHGDQLAEASLTITVAQERLSRSSARAKQASRIAAATIYDTIDAVQNALVHWRPQEIQVQRLTRLSCQRVRQDERGVDVYTVAYRTTWRDHFTDAGKMMAEVGELKISSKRMAGKDSRLQEQQAF